MSITPKQLKFAREYHKCGVAVEAYGIAYDADNMAYSTAKKEAHTVLNHPEVQKELAKLQERAAKKHDITIETITDEYEEARQLARKTEKASAMVSATTGKARLHGLIVEKHEHKVTELGGILAEIDGTSNTLPNYESEKGAIHDA